MCEACRSEAVQFDSVYCFGSYEDSLQKLIHIFKYGKVETLSGPLSKLLIRGLPANETFDAIMPVPMHWRKLWHRGFNQAELLAHPVARRYGLPVSKNLVRSRLTSAQAGLSDAQRRANLTGSFRVHKPHEIKGRRVLLIDDVFTTGATLREASAALKAAGAAHVTVLTLARVDRRTLHSSSTERTTSGASLASSGVT